jgi:hypothetical protein
LQIVIIIYYYNFNNALKKFLRYIFIFYKGRFEMKYLLILFGLSSILASDKSEDPVLKELNQLKSFYAEETEYNGQKYPMWSGIYLSCLDNFTNDYKKFGYNQALSNFEEKPINDGNESCKYWTYSGQLYDKIKKIHLEHHLSKVKNLLKAE